MIRLMDKKIIAILCKLFLLNWPYGYEHRHGSHYAVRHTKTANNQSKSHNVEMGFSLPYRTAFKGKNSLPKGEQILSYKRSPHFEKGHN